MTSNPEIIEAHRRYAGALAARPCEPIEICVAARAAERSCARRMDLVEFYKDLQDFRQLELEAARSFEGDSRTSMHLFGRKYPKRHRMIPAAIDSIRMLGTRDPPS
jgi:hypothetical protein